MVRKDVLLHVIQRSRLTEALSPSVYLVNSPQGCCIPADEKVKRLKNPTWDYLMGNGAYHFYS